MELTIEQKQVIIDEIVAKLVTIANDDDIDLGEVSYYEDERGNVYNTGTYKLCGDIDDICSNGLPGISALSDIEIYAEYDGELIVHYSYDPGDYYTPPYEEFDIESAEIYLTSLDVSVEYEDSEYITLSDKENNEIIRKINELVKQKLN